jgi:hypothetical protein
MIFNGNTGKISNQSKQSKTICFKEMNNKDRIVDGYNRLNGEMLYHLEIQEIEEAPGF